MPRNPKHIPDTASARRRMTSTLSNLFLNERASAYKFVHRGPINWPAFDFAQFPRAVAILVDDCRLFRSRGWIQATVSIEMLAALPTQSGSAIDDGLMDEFYEDAINVLNKLAASVDESGNPIIGRLHFDTGVAIETHDATKGVQGLVVSIGVDF